VLAGVDELAGFQRGALTMSEVHCRRCWQPMPSVALRCPRCGDVDQFRVRRGVAKLLVFLAVTAMALIGLYYYYYFSKR